MISIAVYTTSIVKILCVCFLQQKVFSIQNFKGVNGFFKMMFKRNRKVVFVSSKNISAVREAFGKVWKVLLYSVLK